MKKLAPKNMNPFVCLAWPEKAQKLRQHGIVAGVWQGHVETKDSRLTTSGHSWFVARYGAFTCSSVLDQYVNTTHWALIYCCPKRKYLLLDYPCSPWYNQHCTILGRIYKPWKIDIAFGKLNRWSRRNFIVNTSIQLPIFIRSFFFNTCQLYKLIHKGIII